MLTFIARRLALGLIALIGVTLIVFVASRSSGDVVRLMLPYDATEQQVMQLRAEMGLDQPLPVQYARFVQAALKGDLGQSYKYRQPTLQMVLQRLPATLQLAFAAFVLATAAGITLGVVAARWRGAWPDQVIRQLAVLGQATPNFWVGIMLVLLFAIGLGWLPTSGNDAGLRSMVLPTLTLMVFPTAAIMRVTRSALIESLGSEYVKFLRIKGVPESTILWKHGLRNALVPVIALAGLQVANLLGGTVIVETVFNWPGMGSLIVDAVASRDYSLIQAATLFTSAFLIVLNIVIDISFGFVDPRVRVA